METLILKRNDRRCGILLTIHFFCRCFFGNLANHSSARKSHSLKCKTCWGPCKLRNLLSRPTAQYWLSRTGATSVVVARMMERPEVRFKNRENARRVIPTPPMQSLMVTRVMSWRFAPTKDGSYVVKTMVRPVPRGYLSFSESGRAWRSRRSPCLFSCIGSRNYAEVWPTQRSAAHAAPNLAGAIRKRWQLTRVLALLLQHGDLQRRRSQNLVGCRTSANWFGRRDIGKTIRRTNLL